MRIANLIRVFLIVSFINFVSCSGEGDSGRSGGSEASDFDCDGSCANLYLTIEDVRQILGQAIVGAEKLGVGATIAVIDRVGNVLAVYQMSGALGTTVVNGQIGATGGLEGAAVPATLAAISKAGTGAYLSSQGNAFSTRTASQIIQENFNPGERNQVGGPLFGVQFSQFLCSDVTVTNSDLVNSRITGGKFSFGGGIGPRALPLGLAADPGGLPIYKGGDLVGGVGIELDGVYRLDRDISNIDDDLEERVALTATLGFEAPSQRVAPNMNVGKSLRYTDLGYQDIEPIIDARLEPDDTFLVAVPLFSDGSIRPGVTFGEIESGIAETVIAGVSAAVLVTPDGTPRYPTISGSTLSGIELRASEVSALLDSALVTANRARAAIRRPLDTSARVSIWVVDHLGIPLGFVRSQDAPVFGIDVALQKARSAAFISSSDAGDKLSSIGITGYVNQARLFGGSFFLTGSHAFGARSIGNLARPFFTDGLNDQINGPLSLPFPGHGSGATWSPFNTGLQLDLVAQNVLQPLGGGGVPSSCTDSSVLGRRLSNGLQIFAGGVPLYRGGVLIGAIGVSGDGIDQDDLIAFYGSSREGLDYVGHIAIGDPIYGFNAPKEIRADQIDSFIVSDTRLRYVNCPEAPFSGSNDQNVCEGL